MIRFGLGFVVGVAAGGAGVTLADDVAPVVSALGTLIGKVFHAVDFAALAEVLKPLFG